MADIRKAIWNMSNIKKAIWTMAADVLRAVGGDDLCACAGESCSMASLLNKIGRPYGGCRPEATPTPPWWNFSSARTIEYTAADDGSGMVKTHIRERQQIFTGLPRPVWPNCTKIRPSEQHLPGESPGIDDPVSRTTSLASGSRILLRILISPTGRPAVYL